MKSLPLRGAPSPQVHKERERVVGKLYRIAGGALESLSMTEAAVLTEVIQVLANEAMGANVTVDRSGKMPEGTVCAFCRRADCLGGCQVKPA